MLEWEQEVDAACINGRHSSVARLLMRTDPEYTRIHSFFLADVVDIRNSVTGQAFAHSAAKAGCATTLENLATAGATFDITDFTGNTPLHYAAAGGDASLAVRVFLCSSSSLSLSLSLSLS
jgi:ankyrin repeat protein